MRSDIHKGGSARPKERPDVELDPVLASRSELVSMSAADIAALALKEELARLQAMPKVTIGDLPTRHVISRA